jgi:hypothetical protein
MKLTLKYLIIFFLLLNALFAQTPTPAEISSQVSSYWQSSQIAQLDQYLTTLLSENSNYVPALVASSFHDAIFQGKLVSAKQKLQSIKSDADANAGKYNDEFITAVEGLIQELDHEIAMHARHGTTDATLESRASAMAVRNAWGSDIPPLILIIQIADAVTL